ncbi:MAG: hypothetical protein L0Z50_37875 [Verrucomicrobiales bacterium]|nr:hypothetical protein [Verrucomicrobiales bacterium]
MKIPLRLSAIAAIVAASARLVAADSTKPSFEATFAWLQRVDQNFEKPRFAGLTIEKLNTLTEVQLGGHRKSDGKHVAIAAEEFRHLATLPALQKAVLWEIDGLTDEALVHIGKVSTLRELELGDAPITSAGLKHLRSLESLRFLGLGWTKDITDVGMADLVALSYLEVLVLSGTKVTDAGLAQLARLPRLKELQLADMPQITDAGLLILKSYPQLATIIVSKKTGLTPAGIGEFQKQRPNCQIVVK